MYHQVLNENLNITLDNYKLPIVESAKNLGIIFERNLRFITHVSKLVQKTYVVLKLLYANIHIINYKLCESLVLSILNYGIIVYYSCLDKSTLNRLQKIQNTCIRYIFGLKKFQHVSYNRCQLGWLDLENTYKYHLLIFVHRVLLFSVPDYLKQKLVSRRNIHNVNVRLTDTLTMPQHSTAIFLRSFSYNAITNYNLLETYLKRYSVDTFKSKIKLMLLNQQSI